MYFLLFFLELVGLFLLSQTLSKSISQVIYTTTRSMKATVYVIAFLFLPGTLIHELAHACVAALLQVPVGNMKLLPEMMDGGVKLGSVQIARTDPIRRAIIGVAPFLIGMTILLTLFYVFSKSITHLPFWELILGIYVVFEIANTMFSSKKDLEGTVEIVGAVTLLSVILYIAGVRPPSDFVHYATSPQKVQIIRQFIDYISIPLGIDILVIAVTKGILALVHPRH